MDAIGIALIILAVGSSVAMIINAWKKIDKDD